MSWNKRLAKAPAWLMRRFFHIYPPTRNTGVRIDRISLDWKEWDLRLPLSLKTRNYVGTHFGGTLYSSADPWFMLAWMKILGPEYIVWDKAADIRFKRPGRGTLYGKIRLTDEDIQMVRDRLATEPKFDITFKFQWTDSDGTVCAEVDKLIHFRNKQPGQRGYD